MHVQRRSSSRIRSRFPRLVNSQHRTNLWLEALEDRTVPSNSQWLVQFDGLTGETRDEQLEHAQQLFADAGVPGYAIQLIDHVGFDGVVLVEGPEEAAEEDMAAQLQVVSGFREIDVFDPRATNTSEIAVDVGRGFRNIDAGAGPTENGDIDVPPEATPPAGINGFDGITAGQGGNWRPPDNTGAAGPNSYIMGVNNAVAIYNKATGAAIAGPLSSFTFFNSVRIPGGTVFDPVVVYNELTQRFAVGYADVFGNSQSRFTLAISKSSSPTTLTSADWNFFSYNTDDPSAGFDFGDYPKMGYNADGYVISFNQFKNASFYDHSAVLAVRNDGTSPGIVVVPGGITHFTLAPASTHDNVPNGPMWFVENGGHFGGTKSTINVVRMTNVYTAAPTFTFFPLAVNTYNMTQSPHQPGGQLFGNSNLGTRFYFAGERTVGGVSHLVASHTSGKLPANTFSEVRWYDINITGPTPTLFQQGTISAGASTDTYFPDADIAADGSIGIGYTQSSSGQFISGFVTGRKPADPLGTMQAPVLAKAGTVNLIPADRIGDYADLAVDPVDGSFWYQHQYSSTTAVNPNWRVWIQHFNLGATFNVTSTIPAVGSTINTPPTSFVVNFSANYNPATVAPNDFFVNGIPANSLTLTDLDTVTFHYLSSPANQGLNTMTVNAGSILDTSGNPIGAFSAQFRLDSVPLQITGTNPPPNGVIVLGPATQIIRVFFNEPVNPASVTASDFVVDAGTVGTPTMALGNTAVDVPITGLTTEGTLSLSIAPNAFFDTANNPNLAGFTASYHLDYVTRAYPTPLVGKLPAGSLIYDPTIAGLINFAGDVDTFTLNVDPNQTLTVLVDPAGSADPTLYGGVGNGAGAAAGQLLLINQTNGASTIVGDPVTPGGLSGLVYDPSVSAFLGSTVNGTFSTLVRINPDTGALLSTVGTITDGSGGPAISIGDLAIQPGTNTLFGVRSNTDGAGLGGRLYAINKTTGVATLVGNTGAGAGGGISFAPDGSLYQTAYNNNFDFFSLNKINPANAARISTVPLPTYFDGLAIRPSDGVFYAAQGGSGAAIYTVNPATGAITFVGNTSASTSDLAFRPSTALAPVVTVRDPANNVFGSASAGPGLNALLQTVATTTGGIYKFDVTGAAGSIGGYTVQIVLNAALENEGNLAGASNDTQASAQNLNASFISPDTDLPNAQRGAVLGSLLGGAGNLINNGSFETGAFSPWTTTQLSSPFRPWQVTGAGFGGGFGMLPTAPQDGTRVAWNGFDGNGPGQFTMTQDISLPATSGLTLSWKERLQWNFFTPNAQPRTYFVELVHPVTGGVLSTLYSFSTGTTPVNVPQNTGWLSHSADVSAFGGQTVRLRFREFIPQSFTGPGQAEFDAITLSVPVTGADWYKFTLGAGDASTVAIKALTGVGTGLNLQIFDSAGNPVPAAISTATNLDRLATFTASSAGDYFARVTNTTSGNVTYSLLVMRNAAFDTEPNDTFTTAQNISGLQGALGAITSTASSGPAVLYATGNDGNTLIRINQTTGVATTVGSFGFSQTYAAAFTPDGTLWTIVNGFSSSSARLATVNLATGAATPVGSPNWTGNPIIALEADASGNLYAGNWSGTLYSVNKTTGQLTPIGPMFLSNLMDFTFDQSGQLWAVNGSNGLYRVNTTTGAGTFQAGISGTNGAVMGMMVDPADNSFYVTTYTGNSPLYRLNPTNGTTIQVGAGLGVPFPHGGDFSFGSSASGSTFVVPGNLATAEGNSNNTFPFHPGGNGQFRYQQIYGASQLGAGGLVDQVRFRRDIGQAPFTSNGINVQIALGYAATTVANPSPVFTNNIGSGLTTVFSGLLNLSSTGAGSPNPFDIVIDVVNAFNYNPALGDLLLDVRVFSGPPGFFFFDASGFGQQTGTTRIWAQNNFNAASGIINFDGTPGQPYGLVTRFDFAASSGNDEWYSFNVPSTGNVIRLETTTPGDGPGEPVNTLNPKIELYNPSGVLVTSGVVLPDGRNEVIQYTPLVTGLYRVRIQGEQNSKGDYFLSKNLSPAVTVNVTSPIDEGDTAILTGTITDPDTLDAHTVVINWGPGEGSTTLNLAPGVSSFSATHTYVDDNPTVTSSDTYPISVNVTDSSGGSGSANTSVTVNNVAPTLSDLAVTSPIDENGIATLSGIITDPGAQDTFTLVVDWGEATQTYTYPAGTTAFTATHQYLDDNPTGTSSDVYPVSIVSLTDDDGGAASFGAINNLVNGSFETGNYTGWTLQEIPPTPDFFGIWGIASTGQTITQSTPVFDFFNGVNVTSSSPGLPFTYTATDGNKLAIQLQNGPQRHRMSQDIALSPGTTTLTWDMRYRNHNGSFHSGQFLAVHVRDLADNILQTLFITTQGVNPQSIPMSSFTANLAAFAATTVRIDVEMNVQSFFFDADFDHFVIHGNAPSPNLSVTVNNVPVEIVALNLVSSSINENGTATVNGTIADVGTLDTHTVVINWGPGEGSTTVNLGVGETTFTASHQYLDDNPTDSAFDVYSIVVTATDDDLGSDSASIDLSVNNVAPELEQFVLDECTDRNGAVSIEGTFTDPGTLDKHTVVISWGDGSPDTVINLAVGERGYSATHEYAPGTTTFAAVYTIGVSVTDDDTGSDSASGNVVVAAGNGSYKLQRSLDGANLQLFRGITLLIDQPFDSIHLVIVVGKDNANDSLNVSGINGNPIPVYGVGFSGRDDGLDTLTISSAAYDLMTYTYDNGEDGHIELVQGSVIRDICFDGLEQITTTATTAAAVFNLPDDDNDGVLQRSGTSLTLIPAEGIWAREPFVPTKFIKPTEAMTINGRGGDDIIEILGTTTTTLPTSTVMNVETTEIAMSYNVTLIVGTMVVQGDFEIQEAGAINGNAVQVYGDVTTDDPTLAGTAKISLVGANDQTLTGPGQVPNLDVSKSGGVVDVAAGYFGVRGNLTGSGGTFVAGGGGYLSLQDWDSTINFSGPVTLYNVEIAKIYTERATLLSDMDVAGDLVVWSGGLNLGSHRVTVAGNMFVAADAVLAFDIDVANPPTSPRLDVGGSLTFAAGSVLRIDTSGSTGPSAGGDHELIRAAGGISGFGDVLLDLGAIDAVFQAGDSLFLDLFE